MNALKLINFKLDIEPGRLEVDIEPNILKSSIEPSDKRCGIKPNGLIKVQTLKLIAKDVIFEHSNNMVVNVEELAGNQSGIIVYLT